jgi:D-alanine-D-alanine ligase
MRIGLTFNIRRNGSDRDAVFDNPSTIEAVKKALEARSHRVKLYEASSETLFYRIALDRPQVVFNIAEGRNGIYGEAYVPSILDELRIPYTGSSALGDSLAVNKVSSKMVMQSAGVPIPKLYQSVSTILEEILPINEFPVIVKPVFEGASIGISSRSICSTFEEVKIASSRIMQRLRRSIMIEQFINGNEVTVGVLGNFPPKALSPMEIDFSSLNKRESKASSGIQTFKFKMDYSEKASYYLPARFSPGILSQIQDLAVKAFLALNLRDVARFDMRVDRNGMPYVIEVNAVVGLEPDHSDFPRMYRLIGKTYEELINDILGFALERVSRNERITF